MEENIIECNILHEGTVKKVNKKCQKTALYMT